MDEFLFRPFADIVGRIRGPMSACIHIQTLLAAILYFMTIARGSSPRSWTRPVAGGRCTLTG